MKSLFNSNSFKFKKKWNNLIYNYNKFGKQILEMNKVKAFCISINYLLNNNTENGIYFL